MTESRFDPEDEAFNEIERQAKQRIEAVRAAIDAQNISSCTKWVGLTDEDRYDVRVSFMGKFLETSEFAEQVQLATEAKLKEKNI